jgi:hypothetical protein
VTAIRVAAVSSLEMIGCGEDEVRTFVVEVFRSKLFPGVLRRFFGRIGVEIGWVRHRFFFVFLSFYSFCRLRCGGTPLPPRGGILDVNYLVSMIYGVLVSVTY